MRLYASGQPGGARSDRLLYQAKLALDDQARLNVVRKMYEMRFGEKPPERRSVEQLRGIEGARVKKTYENLAKRFGVQWRGRRYDPADWDTSDVPNTCLSSATACLYGITEAAILAAGYAPAVGFIHTGKPLSFVYDIADIVKFETVVPVAFKIAAKNPNQPEREVRLACRDVFRETKLLGKIIPMIEEVLTAGGLEPPEPPKEAVAPAIKETENSGRCWSSSLKTSRRACVDDLRSGCWRSAPASMSAPRPNGCANSSGIKFWKVSRKATPSWPGRRTPNPATTFSPSGRTDVSRSISMVSVWLASCLQKMTNRLFRNQKRAPLNGGILLVDSSVSDFLCKIR